MKLILKILLAIVVLFILVAGAGTFYLWQGLESGRKLEIGNIDLSPLSDGTYNGKHGAGRWTNEVAVTVKDHKITDIIVVKDVLFSKPEVTKETIDKVIEKQNTDVDVISGSTVTCKAYLKSIENALKK